MTPADAVGAEYIVRIWERGRLQHPIDRGLTILGILSDRPRAELAEMSVERRDCMLLEWRCRLFGDTLTGFAACPACGCGVDVAVTPASLTEPEDHFTVDIDGRSIAVRLPNSLDLAAVASLESVEAARLMLISRCLSADQAAPAGTAADPPRDDDGGYSEPILAAIEAELDRRAEISATALTLSCPDCGHGWNVELDMAAFAWREIEILAGRLLRQVDELARRYGWSEQEILSLSSARRRFYLDLAS